MTLTSRAFRYAAFALAGALGLGLASTAHAFTYAPANGYSADGSNYLADPDSKFDSGQNGGKVQVPGGGTLQFGTQNGGWNGTDRDYSAGVNRMFNPLGRPGEFDGR